MLKKGYREMTRHQQQTGMELRTVFIRPQLPLLTLGGKRHQFHRSNFAIRQPHLPHSLLPILTPVTPLKSRRSYVSVSANFSPPSNTITGNKSVTDDLSLRNSSDRNNSQSTTKSSPASILQNDSLVLLEWPAITARVLRHASTNLGREALLDPNNRAHLNLPSTQRLSEALLNQTREIHHLEYTLAAPLTFSPAKDVRPIATQATKGRLLAATDLLDVARTLSVARVIRRQIIDDDDENVIPTLHALVAQMKTAVTAEKEILRCIDEYGEVLDAADPALRSIRDGIRQATADARQILNGLMSRHTDAIQDRLITTRYDRFVIPVKMSHKAVFRGSAVHDASASGGTAYMEPSAVRPVNDRLRQLAAKERAAIAAVLRRLSEEVIAPIADDLCIVCDILALLDAAAARARASESLKAVDVVFDNEAPLNLPAVRHPLLMWTASDSVQGGEGTSKPLWVDAVVPSTYELSQGVRCVCVTGPNTGGKTLSLKTLGVTALMAKAGLFVPATLPRRLDIDFDTNDEKQIVRIPYFDNVLADIGDDQSLVQSLSTFSGHVRRIKRIIATSTAQSLVLLDEIGSGTDPAEGAALGMAVLRHLAIGKRAGLTFATTHHGELKTLKYGKDGNEHLFENASVEFDDVAMKPTFRLIWGIPGRSNALAIAERLGLDIDVVEEARSLLSGDDGIGSGEDGKPSRIDFEEMIRSLEQDKVAAEIARADAENSLMKIDVLRDDLSARLNKLKESEQKLRLEQKAAMEAEVKEARRQIAKVIREMQHGGGSAQAAGRASDQINDIEKQKLAIGNQTSGSPKKSAGPISIDDIKVGDRVLVTGLGDGEVDVVQIVSKKEVMIAMGAMKAKVKIRDLLSIRRGRSAAASTSSFTNTAAPNSGRQSTSDGDTSAKARLTIRTAANSIDIRGERVDTAMVKVERAIDKAFGIGTLWIVHGHGTGRLRTGIRTFLSDHTLVSRIENAEQSEGGTGVTIAYL